MIREEVFKDVGEGETDDRHRYPLRRELGGGTRQYSMDTPDISQEDCVIYAVGVLPLERFGYLGGEAEGSREFPVSKMIEDLGNDFYRKIWSGLMTKVRTRGFRRGRGRGVGDGQWLGSIFAWNRREVICLEIILSEAIG